MANEIKVLEGSRDGLYQVLFLYPVPTPQTYTDGAGVQQTVVPTPAPTEGRVSEMLGPGERNALDAGDAAYEVVTYGPDPAVSNADNVAALRRLYADRKAAFDADYQARFRFLGVEVDAT